MRSAFKLIVFANQICDTRLFAVKNVTAMSNLFAFTQLSKLGWSLLHFPTLLT